MNKEQLIDDLIKEDDTVTIKQYLELLNELDAIRNTSADRVDLQGVCQTHESGIQSHDTIQLQQANYEVSQVAAIP